MNGAAAGDMHVTLEESYRRCRQLTKAHGTSYYWATKVLPAVKQPHVHALYALCRYADDIVDEFDDAPVSDRINRLDRFEQQLMAGLVQRRSDHPILKAVVATSNMFDLPADAYGRFFASMRSDLGFSTFVTYDDLLSYMDGSAAVIGELMLPILEPFDDSAVGGARDLGIAFQLTNFLRDVGEDLSRGRVYFPSDELAKFDVDIQARRVDDNWRGFCHFQIDRMHTLYRSADEAIALLPPSSAASITAARRIYSAILERIVANDFDVFSMRARVPAARKVAMAAGAVVGPRLAQLTRRRDPQVAAVTEMVVLVDAEDRPVGTAEKLAAHQPPGQRHRAFSLFVHDGRGRLLLQKRADSKHHFAGRWSNTCCSHPRPGEEVVEAAVRRFGEEIGAVASDLLVVGSFEYRALDEASGLVEHELDHVVVGYLDPGATSGLAAFDRCEVSAVRWVDIDELRAEMAATPDAFTPWLAPALKCSRVALAFGAGVTA